ncbi:MAG: adenylate kinase family protein [Candidatus Heimdallarchaeota archaeon]
MNHNFPQVIIISGTPGVGKTSVSIELQKQGYSILNLNDFIITSGLYFGYDYSRESVIIDDEILIEKLTEEFAQFKGILFVEGHTAELVPNDFVSNIFVIRCNPSILRTRLQVSRKYTRDKIEDNVQAEIMDDCLLNLQHKFPKISITELDSSKFDSKTLANKILEIIN